MWLITLIVLLFSFLSLVVLKICCYFVSLCLNVVGLMRFVVCDCVGLLDKYCVLLSGVIVGFGVRCLDCVSLLVQFGCWLLGYDCCFAVCCVGFGWCVLVVAALCWLL